MDVVELLKKDHETVSNLFTQFKGGDVLTRLVNRVTGSGPPRGRRAIVERICRELDIHTRVEEELVYPSVRATGDEKLVCYVDESLKEHGRVKEHVARLRGRSLEGEALENEVGELQKEVDHHVNEEEGGMFPRLEDVMSEDARVALGRRVQARKRVLGGGATQRPAARATASRARSRTAARSRKVVGRKARAKRAKKASRRTARR